MKKFLSIILAVLMIVTSVPIAFAAEEYTEGNFIYTVENGEATITRYTGHDKVVVIPDTLGGYPATTIGDRAFYYFRSITEITIPDSVTTIGASAFESCESLTEITIPDSVTTIGAGAFDTCKSLTEITIPGSVTTINDNTFDTCESLTKITIPDSVTSIGRFAFNKCINLTEIIIPNSVISIAGYAFSECINLTEITIPNSVISIENYVFYKCTSLKEITIPHSVTQFGQYVFLECTALEKVNVPCTWNRSLSVDATVTLNKVHDIIIDEAVAPKCGETGLTQGEYCTRCDYKVEQEVVPALNHKDTLVEVDAKAPTCTEIGWDAYEYCTACDYTTCVEIPALTHTDANCDYKCDYNCGYEYETLDFSDAKVLSSDADGYLCIDGVKIDEDSARSAQYLPTGKYKLEGDIISNDCIIWIQAEEQVIINLNSYKWTLGDSITLDGELSLYDLSEGETGKIVASTNWGNVNMQEESSVLNLYSGTLESTGGCALRFQKGNANLYGGKLKSDKYVIRNNVAKGNKGIDIDGTVLECGDGYAQILCSSTSNSVTESFIDVSDYTGDYLTVEFDVKKSGKYTIFEGIKNAQEADKYSIDVKYEERHEIFFDKTEYDEATGEKCVYIKSNAFVQQPSPENNYTVGFSNPDASFQWYEVEETSSRVHTAVNDMTIYTNNFKAGDILKVSTDSEIRRVILYSDYGSLDLDEDTKTAMIKFDTDVTVEFVPSVLDAENPVKLEFSIINETLLDGATGKTLKDPEFRKEYYCKATVGKFVYTSDIVAGHYIVRVDAKAPTCTEIGWDAYVYCIDCNYTSYVEKEALNHKDTLVKVDAKAPTCTEIGWDAYEYCTACDYTTYVEKEALNHKDTLVKVDAKAPTCTEIGWDAYEYCTACTYTTYVEIPVDADAHDYTNHYCKTCGKVEDGYYAGTCGAVKAEDVIWSLDSEGTLTISGEGEYSVPFYDAPWLAYKESIKNVVIEEGITNIPWASFYDLFNAVSLSIPSTVASIDEYGNNSFIEIKLADGNNYYSVVDDVLLNYDKTELIMYPAKKADETYTVPDGVTILGSYAFYLSENLKTVNISDDVTTIKDSCFEYSSVENINFGKNVEVIESKAFADAGLKTVVLPEKLEEISEYLFYSCDSLETLVIGSKVTSIDNDIISYCDNIETVHFTGTEEQWQAITKPDNSEDAINTIEVHFGALEEKDGIDATCAEAGYTSGLYCDECNAYITGEEIPATGNHTYVDGKCECGDECKHPGQTGAECEICGSALHVCDFSGEWNYSDEYHWKECSCGEISEEIAHTYIDGVCECGFVCLHDSITVYGWDFCYTCGYIVAEEIALDTPHTVTEDHFVKFIPEVSGSYYFRSYDTRDGADPEGYAYEGNIRNCLGFIGSNNNFLYGNPAYNEITFEAELTAGKTYYFELFEYRKTQNSEPFEYTVMIKKICDNGAHSFTDSICDACGYECFHPVATEGVCDNCGSACTHNKQDKVITVRPVQNDDGTWEKGTVEITCLVCGNTETKEVERDHEGYKTFDETAAKLEALINSDELIDYPKNSYTASLNNIKNSAYSQVYTEIEGAIPSMTDSLNSIIATIEAGLADGTMKKADWTFMTAMLDEIKALIDNDPNKIIPSMVGYYYGPNGFYSGSFGNPNYPQSDYDRVMAEYGFKNQLETLLAGLKDGSALKADYTEIDEAIAEIEQKLADENVTDEAKADLEEIKSQLEEMKQNPISSEADLAELEKALEDYETELDAGIEDGSAVKVDGLEEIVNINDKLNNELAEKYGEEALAEIAEKLDEKFADKFDELYERAEALTGSVAENKDALAEIEAEMEAIFAEAENCLNGTHNGLKFEVTAEAKCGENAIESATCTLCGETVTREVENSALTHSFTKYEVTEEAKCGVEGKKVAACDRGCGATDEKAIAALTHKDADGDYECDNGCGHEFEKPAPEEPTDKACDHLCHKGGFVGFIWKIVQFFCKLFKMNPVCACGAAHY